MKWIIFFIMPLVLFAGYGDYRKGDATISIAPYDSPLWHRWTADYICDGDADEVEINTGINTVAAIGGGSVYLYEGNFTTTLATINMKDSVDLISCSPIATTIKSDSNFDIITVYNITNARIKNIGFYGQGDHEYEWFKSAIHIQKSHHITVENCKAQNFDGPSFLCTYYDDYPNDTCSNIRLINLEACNNFSHGIEVTGTRDADVISCFSHDNGHMGMEVWRRSERVSVIGGYYNNNSHHGLLIKGTTNVTATGVKTEGNTMSGFEIAADSVIDNHNITLTSCFAYGNGEKGVEIGAYTNNVNIIGVIADNNTDGGLVINGAADTLITKNIIIDDCQFVNNGFAGISVGYDSASDFTSRIDNVKIGKCLISNNGSYGDIYHSDSATTMVVDENTHSFLICPYWYSAGIGADLTNRYWQVDAENDQMFSYGIDIPYQIDGNTVVIDSIYFRIRTNANDDATIYFQKAKDGVVTKIDSVNTGEDFAWGNINVLTNGSYTVEVDYTYLFAMICDNDAAEEIRFDMNQKVFYHLEY